MHDKNSSSTRILSEVVKRYLPYVGNIYFHLNRVIIINVQLT